MNQADRFLIRSSCPALTASQFLIEIACSRSLLASHRFSKVKNVSSSDGFSSCKKNNNKI